MRRFAELLSVFAFLCVLRVLSAGISSGEDMKPELLALTPFYAPALAALEREYVLHKLWEARDPDALIKQVAPNIRGLVTTGLKGCKREHLDALSKLEII